MASASKASLIVAASKVSLVVAASVGTVEALKDQVGLCRWNYTLRSLHQRAKSNVGSLTQANRKSSATVERSRGRLERAKRTEQTLEKVMYLSCYGPK